MQNPFGNAFTQRSARGWPAVLAGLLAACGGGGTSETQTAAEPMAAAVATASTTLEVQTAHLSEAEAARVAEPSFHIAPLLLAEPGDADVLQPGASATQAPHRQAVPPGNAGLSTRRLTVDRLLNAQRQQRLASAVASGDGAAVPAAGSGFVATYTPAQVRAAYGLPALPAAGIALTAAQAAALGAGQTVYVIGARHNPNVAAELAAFNQKFGLPACTTKPIAPNASLPLAAASPAGCELSVVYATAAGGMTASAPAYESGWATEMALDVQWAHATAPLARIVLIEAPDPSVNSLLGAVRVANAMRPGAVSMSFGAAEGSYTAQVDALFTAPGMTYLAATGDWGTGVFWPSVSPNVLAVGGTTLNWSGAGARSEVAWSGTGGGMSAYTARPPYQTAAVPGLGTPLRRTLADVAFNADPATGQYVAVMAPGSSTVNWISAGGTSLSTPQWAGLVAVANALRAQAAKPTLAGSHGVLYQQIGAVPGSYAAAFADVVLGSNGSCSLCTAKAGHDSLTGLGTPQAAALLAVLAGAGTAALPPVVTPATITGQAGKPLSFTVSVSAANPVSYTLSGAPAGMAIAATGVVSWAAPVAGSYAVGVTARDSKTALTGQAVYKLTITAPPSALAPPVVAAATVSGQVGTALRYTATASAANALTWSLSGAPAGMVIASNGVLSWPSPLAGNYNVKLTARDSKTGSTGQGTLSVQISAAAALSISAPPMTGAAGKALAGSIAFSAPGAASVSITIGGVPLGMMFTPQGSGLAVSWAKPVKGSYSLAVKLKDSLGRTASATVPVMITAP